MRSAPSPAPRSRSFTRRTATGPIPVWTRRSGAWPCRTTRSRPSGSRAPFIVGQERLGFRLDSLGQQPAGAAPQDGRQRVVDLVGLAEGDNGAIAHRGVSLLREVLAGSSPASIRRLSHTAITQFRP